MNPTTGPLIELHREMHRADLEIPRLVSRQPPTALDPNTGELFEEPAPRIGMAMSGGLLRFLGHPEGYGSQFPWASALWRLKARCRRTHPAHRAADRPYWRGSLCWSLVQFTVVRGFSLDSAARILRIDRETEQTLRNALQIIEEELDTQRKRAEDRAREDEGRAVTCRCGDGWARHGGAVVDFRCLEDGCGCGRYMAEKIERHERHDQGGMHQIDCPVCRRMTA